MNVFEQSYKVKQHKRRLVEMRQKLGRHDPLVVAMERRVREMRGGDD